MRDDVKRGNEDLVAGLLALGIFVLTCVLGYFMGHYLFDKPLFRDGRMDIFLLPFLHWVLMFACGLFYVFVLEPVFKLFQIRLNDSLEFYLSYLVPIITFLLLDFLFSNGDSERLFNLGVLALIYFILPFGVSLFIAELILRALGYSSKPKEKTIAKGSQSSAVSPANHREVKADKPIVWNFADYAKRWVVGQDHAIETIQKVLVANSKLADLGNPKRQRILASFLFVGPTGVGKTETAKALASWLKDYGYSSLRLDANQFSDRESTWTLLGSPKGYVGSDKPGLLPYAISQNPKQIILIDEIEKADQGFYQFLLQMLDEGYVIERSTGSAYYLQRAIVIITSNLENKRIAEIMETLSNPIEIDIAVRKTLEEAVVKLGGGRTFRITPEFLGRIDEIIPFRSLGFEDLVQIAYRELRGLGVNVSYETVYELTQKYYPIAKEYGVRYFLNKVQEDVLTQ
jgi:hypothetical protein